MGHAFHAITMTPAVKARQVIDGSRDMYAKAERGEATYNRMTEREAAFIAERDSFYIASVTETGWPYIQHRGGPKGFLKVLDETTLGFLDFRGNRQFLTVGNLVNDDRVSLFLMDYAGRRRLKVLGRAASAAVSDRPDIAPRLSLPGYRAEPQRIVTIEVQAFDWNCPQHITPRFTEPEILTATEPLRARIAELEATLGALKRPWHRAAGQEQGGEEAGTLGIDETAPR
jgi:uncharacterized protein